MFDHFIESLSPAVLNVSLGIAIITIIIWFRMTSELRSMVSELRNLRKFFDESDKQGREVFRDAASKSKDENIKAILNKTESAMFDLPGEIGIKTYSLRMYQDEWTPGSLLAKRINLSLYEAAPNILIGAGLLATFSFLALALADAIPALSTSNIHDDEIRKAIESLLKNASGKFLTSITGMACSLTWTWRSKRHLEALQDEIESLCVAMNRRVEDSGSEAAISAQIATLSEILIENREQVGQLKRFETDFAVAIGKALGSQMQPAFEQLTSSITKALDTLTEKVGSMNEDALKKMLADFQTTISNHTSSEMNAFKQALIDIADQIKDAGKALEQAGGETGRNITEGGRQFTDALAGGAGDLRQAANLLEQAMITAKATVNDVDEAIERATEEGTYGLESLRTAISQLSTVTGEVNKVVSAITAISGDFKTAANAAAETTRNLQSVLKEQNELVTTVSGSASSLGSALTSANTQFRATAETMKDTTSEMASGVENYSTLIAKLHTELDNNLAIAIQKLSGTTTELVDGLEDFLEEFRDNRRQ